MSEITDKQIKQLGRVAVFMGGDSAERQVSLNSGQAALDALLRKGIDAFAIDIRFKNAETASSVCEQIKAQAFDTAFIALHGRGGEDGIIQGVLEALAIPYTGCGVAASAFGMDKLRTKLLWAGSDLPTPAFEILKVSEVMTQDSREIDRIVSRVSTALGFPVMVKPAHEGSSIGMTKVDEQTSLWSALKTAAEHDSEILIEEWVVGAEYTGAVLNGRALPLIRLETPREFYDYQAKYLTNDTLYHCPCGLDEQQEEEYQALVLAAFNCIGAKGWGRVDFICDQQGKPWLIEINTVPGLTDHSLVPMAAKNAGIEFDDLMIEILTTAHNDSGQISRATHL